jgi:hypothetical protein
MAPASFKNSLCLLRVGTQEYKKCDARQRNEKLVQGRSRELVCDGIIASLLINRQWKQTSPEVTFEDRRTSFWPGNIKLA